MRVRAQFLGRSETKGESASKVLCFQGFFVDLAAQVRVEYRELPARRKPTYSTQQEPRGARGIRDRRQGHLPESWSWHHRTHRDQDDHGDDLWFLSASDGERNDRVRAGRQRRRRRPAARGHRRRSERLFALLGDGKIDSHQNWKGRFKDNSDRMRTGSIYDVVEVLKSLTFLGQVEEPLVPREAHARPREVPGRLRDDRSAGREDRRGRSQGRSGARALLRHQGHERGQGQGGATR